ncbi:MAG: hypothetical protein JWP94_2959 [Mucilaginibacter sp.]|nr:hypothetical protein [Mucilaginibacter sp.]
MIGAEEILLKDIFEQNDLSVRAYNVTLRVELKTVKDLKDYIKDGGDFLRVSQCGERTNKELLEIAKTDISGYNTSEHNNASEITPVEDNLEFLLNQKFTGLSVRAKNALDNLFGYHKFTLQQIENHFIKNDFSALTLRNVGVKTAEEINKTILSVKDLYFSIVESQLSPKQKAAIKIKQLFGVDLDDESLIEQYLNHSFPIIYFSFLYAEFLLRKDKVGLFVYKNHFGFLEKEYSLEDMAQLFSLTRERIRQRRRDVIEKLRSQFCRLKDLLDHSKYDSILEHVPVFLNTDEVLLIKDEIELMGHGYSVFILERLFGESYFSLSEYDRFTRPAKVDLYEKWKEVKTIRGAYLVSRRFFDKPAILKLYQFLVDLLCVRRENDEIFSIRSIFDNLSNADLDYLNEFLNRELELSCEEYSIQIPRTTVRLIYEYALQALETIGRPAHITEIYSYIKTHTPGLKMTENSLRAAIANRKNLFIYFGRSSTFGLKSWEEKNAFIKGGTIRTIVEEFLNQHENPCHISDITLYVNRYRNTDQYSVINNLKMTEDNRFVFFKNNHIGLSAKDYDSRTKNSTARISDVSIDDLMINIFSR